jgi:thioredoxin-related protein
MRRILIFVLLAVIGAGVVIAVDTNETKLSVDMSKTVTDTNVPPVDLAAEVARAKAENKLLVLEFGSSDSCPPCVGLQKYVFSTPEFEAYAQTNLDFIRLDYPQWVDLRPDTQATNKILALQFDVEGFPTLVALDGSGKEFWRKVGVPVALFNSKKFIAQLEAVKKNEK